jgi:hypothetical protein
MELLTAIAHGLLAAAPDGPTPVLLSVPMAEIDDMVPGNPKFDAAMAEAVRRGRGGVLVIPAEMEFPQP